MASPNTDDRLRIARPKPRAQAVADALRDLVQERRLVPCDRLPSEA
jgi:DNA-binding FadR family transcriptional regulator